MALTPSKMLALGTKAPALNLPDTDGKLVCFDNALGAKGFLVMFICNHCPFVKHIRQGLAAVTGEYLKKGIAVFGVNANDADNYPEDRPEKMKEEKNAQGYLFPYLFDETQEVAKAYEAACTPDFFLFDADRKLVYRGQFDDSRPGNGAPVTGADLKAAMDAVLRHEAPSSDQRPSIGCNIKWK
jgi:peroxiredoxin